MRVRARLPRLLCTAVAAAVLQSALAHAPRTAVFAPEPAGYWMGPTHGPVPRTLAGGRIIQARALAALLRNPRTVVVDVSSAPRRPPQLARSARWLPLPHRTIPGALWIPGAGLGAISPDTARYFRERLAAATGGDMACPVVVYCHTRCWLSWNGAKRAISYGYRNVYWFPDGIEGWRAARLPTSATAALP